MKYSKSTYINALMWYCGIPKNEAVKEYNRIQNDHRALNLFADCYNDNAKKIIITR